MYDLLFNTTLIQGLGVSGGIPQMFRVTAGKIVGAREVLFGTHVKILMIRRIQHRIDASHRRHLDRTWRQSAILVGVVRALGIQHIVVDTFQRKVFQCELHRGVCLQGHTFLQTVQIHTGNHRLLGIVGGLFVDDARQRTYLIGIQPEGSSLSLTIVVPELVVLFLHAGQEVLDRCVPVHLVGVWHKQADDGGRVVTHLGA